MFYKQTKCVTCLTPLPKAKNIFAYRDKINICNNTWWFTRWYLQFTILTHIKHQKNTTLTTNETLLKANKYLSKPLTNLCQNLCKPFENLIKRYDNLWKTLNFYENLWTIWTSMQNAYKPIKIISKLVQTFQTFE